MFLKKEKATQRHGLPQKKVKNFRIILQGVPSFMKAKIV